MTVNRNDGRATLRDLQDMQRNITDKLDEIQLRINAVDLKITDIKSQAKGIAFAISIVFGIATLLLSYLLKR